MCFSTENCENQKKKQIISNNISQDTKRSLPGAHLHIIEIIPIAIGSQALDVQESKEKRLFVLSSDVIGELSKRVKAICNILRDERGVLQGSKCGLVSAPTFGHDPQRPW